MTPPDLPGVGRPNEADASPDERTLAWAKELANGSHYCDYGEHRHDVCDCPCSVCFSFWHFNVRHFEEARKLVRGGGCG